MCAFGVAKGKFHTVSREGVELAFVDDRGLSRGQLEVLSRGNVRSFNRITLALYEECSVKEASTEEGGPLRRLVYHCACSV